MGSDTRGRGRSQVAASDREIDLIKRAIRVGPPAAEVDGELDWPALVTLARSHGVLALVGRSLKAQGWQGVPADVVQTMTAYRASLTARNLLLTRRLLEILEQLDAHGITALPYKGPLLAVCAYGDVGMRPFGDLDLIVSAREALAARDLLVARGYRSLSPRTDSHHPAALPPGYAMALQAPDDGVVVELHWKLSPSVGLGVEELLPAARPFSLLGATVLCLSPEQLLLALCVHGAKHAWERLEWVCGVAHLIGRQPALEWDLLAAQANGVGASRSVALGLALAAGVAGAPVPDPVLRRLGATSLAPLARQMEHRLFRQAPGSSAPAARYSSRLRAASMQERVRYLLFLRRPTEKDRAFVALPRRLSFLYPVVRPIRVAWEHAPRRVGRDRRPPAAHRQAQRALARQLEHQQQKAAALRGREDVTLALTLRWARVERRLRRVKPDLDAGGRFLEVGSGAYGILFGSGLERAVGVDPLALEYAGLFPVWQQNVPTLAALGERLPFADGAFDVVICDNVVDHAEQPAAILAEISRVLAPGGLLYFTVNVHHPVYSLASRAHKAWNAAGIRLEIGPFADHTVHLTPAQARDLFEGQPVDIRRQHTYLDEARERARRRRIRHPGHVLPWIFFKNARFEVVAQRR